MGNAEHQQPAVASDRGLSLNLQFSATALHHLLVDNVTKRWHNYWRNAIKRLLYGGDLKTSFDYAYKEGEKMAYILLFVFLTFCTFAMSPAFGVLFLGMLVAAIVYTISDANKQYKEDIESIRVGSEKIGKNLADISFKSSKRIDLGKKNASEEILVDTSGKQIAVCDYLKTELKILPFSALLSCEILEDNAIIMKGGVGRAIVGGVIAGSTGAVVGATTRNSKSVAHSLIIKIITSDINDSLVTIPLITEETKRDSDMYKKMWTIAQEVHSTITSIIQTTNCTATDASSQKNALAQIQMLSELKDQGAITEEEFSKKKAELLDRV